MRSLASISAIDEYFKRSSHHALGFLNYTYARIGAPVGVLPTPYAWRRDRANQGRELPCTSRKLGIMWDLHIPDYITTCSAVAGEEV